MSKDSKVNDRHLFSAVRGTLRMMDSPVETDAVYDFETLLTWIGQTIQAYQGLEAAYVAEIARMVQHDAEMHQKNRELATSLEGARNDVNALSAQYHELQAMYSQSESEVLRQNERIMTMSEMLVALANLIPIDESNPLVKFVWSALDANPDEYALLENGVNQVALIRHLRVTFRIGYQPARDIVRWAIANRPVLVTVEPSGEPAPAMENPGEPAPQD